MPGIRHVTPVTLEARTYLRTLTSASYTTTAASRGHHLGYPGAKGSWSASTRSCMTRVRMRAWTTSWLSAAPDRKRWTDVSHKFTYSIIKLFTCLPYFKRISTLFYLLNVSFTKYLREFSMLNWSKV